jgi:hypothetical protein
LDEYLPNVADMLAALEKAERYKPEIRLPGQGGVYNAYNTSLYAYGDLNPLRMIDPDGNADEDAISRTAQMAAVGGALGGVGGAAVASGCAAATAGVCGLGAPAIISGGVASGAVTGIAIERAWSQLETLVEKANQPGPDAVQYALIAEASGVYPTATGGTTFMNAGDVWKYGVTGSPEPRYSRAFLTRTGMGLRMVPEVQGTRTQVFVAEKIKLIDYAITHGELPPGNKIFK